VHDASRKRMGQWAFVRPEPLIYGDFSVIALAHWYAPFAFLGHTVIIG
jgi:hypothetical protein